MKNTNKIITSLSLLFLANTSAQAFSASWDIGGFGYIVCWEDVVTKEWTGAAKTSFQSIETTYKTALKTIDTKREQNNKEILSAIADAQRIIESTILDNQNRNEKEAIKATQQENNLAVYNETVINNLLTAYGNGNEITHKINLDANLMGSQMKKGADSDFVTSEGQGLEAVINQAVKGKDVYAVSTSASSPSTSGSSLSTGYDFSFLPPKQRKVYELYDKYCQEVKKSKMAVSSKIEAGKMVSSKESRSAGNRVAVKSVAKAYNNIAESVNAKISKDKSSLVAENLFSPTVKEVVDLSKEGGVKKDLYTLSESELSSSNNFADMVCMSKPSLAPTDSDTSYYRLAYYQKQAMDSLCESTMNGVISRRTANGGGTSDMTALSDAANYTFDPVGSANSTIERNKIIYEVNSVKLLVALYERLDKIEVLNAAILSQKNNNGDVKGQFKNCVTGKGCL